MEDLKEEYLKVKIEKVIPNEYNPKKTEDHEERYQAIKDGITTMGMKDPLEVRELEDGTYEIMDGYHRWKACQELGWLEIPIINYGKVTREFGMKLSILKEKARIPLDVLMSAEVLKKLVEGTPISELTAQTGYSKKDLEEALELSSFDWENYEGNEIELSEEDTRIQIEVDKEAIPEIKKVLGEINERYTKPDKRHLLIIGTLKITLLKEQFDIVKSAIDRAKKEGGTDSDARALELISADYLAS